MKWTTTKCKAGREVEWSRSCFLLPQWQTNFLPWWSHCYSRISWGPGAPMSEHKKFHGDPTRHRRQKLFPAVSRACREVRPIRRRAGHISPATTKRALTCVQGGRANPVGPLCTGLSSGFIHCRISNGYAVFNKNHATSKTVVGLLCTQSLLRLPSSVSLARYIG